MCFWKCFAWLAFCWALVMRRGKGVLIRKKDGNVIVDVSSKPKRERSWRRVSSRRVDIPAPDSEKSPSDE